METELSKQQQERDKLNAQIAREAENSALVENVKVLLICFYHKQIRTFLFFT